MSIRTRLILWYTGLLAVTLFVFGFLVYSLLSSVLVSVLDDRLATQARNVTNLIRAENDPLSVLLSGRARLPPIDVFASQYYVQIINVQGVSVQVSDNLHGQYLPVPPEVLTDIKNGRSGTYTLNPSRGLRLRVYYTPISLANQPVGAVLVGQSLSNLDEALVVVRSTMLLGTITTLLLAAIGGAVLARAALRPIQTISDTAHTIALAEDLSRRVPTTSVPNDELGQLTATINDMLARLEAVFQTQQRLVADVSHELRTPLTTIRGNLELLQRGAIDDELMRAEALTAIQNETSRMHRLVNDLLLLAQADAGLKLHMQPVEVDTLLLEVYRQALVMAQGKITVKLGAEDQALVEGDPDRLRQLLLNLVDNAVKYTPPGGQVTLTLQKDSQWVQVAVADTGAGIAPEDLPHIFERFYRASRNRGRPGGAGLGLSIADWVARAHGGRLQVESSPGGSVFRVWLPLSPDDHVAPALEDGQAVLMDEADEEPEHATG